MSKQKVCMSKQMDKGRFDYWGACRKFGTRYIHTLPYQRLHKQHEKTSAFPPSSYLLAAVETHDGVFNHTTTRNKKATIHWCQSQQSSGAQSRKRGWWKARSMTQHTMKAAATVLWCSGSSCRQLSPFSEWLL